jgi:phosphatidate cytidylyltransferase
VFFRLIDTPTIVLLVSNLAVLAALFGVGRFLRKRSSADLDAETVRAFSRNMLAWIIVCVVLALALMFNAVLTVIFFWFVSFWAQREFVTLTPTRPSDHRTLFFLILVFPIAQYVMVGLGQYDLYSIVIPVYGTLFIASRIAFANDNEGFLERSAKLQFGLLICVYALSHAPALLTLDLLMTWDGEAGRWTDWQGAKGGLLLYLVVIVQISEMTHFIADRTLGRHVIANEVHEAKSWEGLIAALVVSAIVGILIQIFLPVTPFQVLGSGVMAMIISVMASSGSMTMYAIKRDRAVARQGVLVQTRGVLDRIASLCFAAPIYFHVTRFFLEVDSLQEIEQANEQLLGWWPTGFWM